MERNIAHKACQKYCPEADADFSERTPPTEAYDAIAKAHDIVLEVHLYIADELHRFCINPGGKKAVVKLLSSGTSAAGTPDVRNCSGHFDYFWTVSLETVVEEFCQNLANVYVRTGDLDFSDFKALEDPLNVAAGIRAWMNGDEYADWNRTAATSNDDPQVLGDAFAKLLEELSNA